MRLYIDPGTGSMLFTILIGVLGAAFFALRGLLVRLRFMLSGGRAERSRERTPLVIFTDSGRYWNLFGPVLRELERRGAGAVYLTADRSDPALSQEFRHVSCRFAGEGNQAFTKMNLLSADVVLTSTPGLDVYQWKRSRDVSWYVHVPHMANDITTYRMFGTDFFDALLLSGPMQQEQIRALERVRKLPPKELVLAGMPYLDALREKLEAAGPAGPHETTVLLAPSWGESAILRRFGGEMIEALLQTGAHVVVRPHPQSFTSEKELLEDLMRRYPESGRLEWNRDNDNFEVLRRSDLLISDFSGVIFDFALVFDRPVIMADTDFDKAPYDACWLEEEMWTFRILPEIGRVLTRENFPNLGEMIRECLRDDRYAEGRARARREAWAHPGEAAGRICDYLVNKQREIAGARAAQAEAGRPGKAEKRRAHA